RRGERALLRDERGERRSVDELHRQVDQSIGRLAEIVDGGDVWMTDAARVGRFAIESADRIDVRHQPGVEHLEGALAAHLDVFGEIDLAHAAFAELAQHTVTVGDDRADQIGARCGAPQGRTIRLAKARVGGIRRAALRTDSRRGHAGSPRRMSSRNTGMEREYRMTGEGWSMNCTTNRD